MPEILATKIGMSQLFTDDGEAVPVTVLEAGPCPVTAVRTEERDGYSAVQLAWARTTEKRMTRAELGHLRKSDSDPHKTLVEFRDPDGEHQVGEQVTVEAFEPGMTVKVAAISKGKGFQGTVKRHGFGRGPETHGSHNVRAPGSIGAAADPARVFKGMRMPGQMGGKRVSQQGLEVVRVDPDENLLIVRGSVPGGRNATVEVRTQ